MTPCKYEKNYQFLSCRLQYFWHFFFWLSHKKKYNKQQVKTFLFLISTSSNMVQRKTIMRLMASYNYFKCRGWATHPILESFKPNPELVLLFG